MPFPVPTMITAHDAFCAYLEKHQQWGLYISFCEREGEVPAEIQWAEMQKAARFLVLPDDPEILPPDSVQHVQCLLDGYGYFIFDTQEAMEHAFWTCVGDDGPTDLNPDGSQHYTCFALTFGPYQGNYQMLTTNT